MSAQLGMHNPLPSAGAPRVRHEAGAGAFLVKPFGVNGAVAVDTPGKKCFLTFSSSSLIDVLLVHNPSELHASLQNLRLCESATM